MACARNARAPFENEFDRSRSALLCATAPVYTRPKSEPDTATMAKPSHFNVAIVGQAGRLGYEALLFAASLRQNTPDFSGRLLIAEPQPGPLWPNDPRIRSEALRNALADHGAELIPFESQHFGHAYPNGNKIEMLSALPEGEPFVFFDTDTLILGDLAQIPFDFDRPTASTRVTNTWPKTELYGPSLSQTWKALYDRFDLDFEASLDLDQPDEY